MKRLELGAPGTPAAQSHAQLSQEKSTELLATEASRGILRTSLVVPAVAWAAMRFGAHAGAPQHALKTWALPGKTSAHRRADDFATCTEHPSEVRPIRPASAWCGLPGGAAEVPAKT